MRRQANLLILLLILSALSPLAPPSRPAEAQGNRLVLAFYYPWWEYSDWSRERMSDLPSPQYSGGEDATIIRHIEQAQGAGVDAFICTWFGNQGDERLNARCNRLMELIEAGGYSLKVTVIPDQAADYTGRLRTIDGMVGALRYAQQNWFSRPSYLKIDGRPVVTFWNMPSLGGVGAWQTVRDTVDPGRGQYWLSEGVDFDYLDVAEAQYYYDIAWTPDPARAMGAYRENLAAYNQSRGTSKPFVATVMPGYDDTRAGGTGVVRDRAGGEYYRSTWRVAGENNAQLAIITSWNEYFEGHHIEPSENFGDLYLRLTAELSGQFKAAPAAPPPPNAAPPPSGSFADEAFARVWQRADRAVAESRASRSWTWGPVPNTGGLQEPYNGGTRLVQYFDKSRMEINNPGGDRSSPWFVTNGLLVREMVTGRLQTGDSDAEQRTPAREPLAGDPASINPDAPTYASLDRVIDRAAPNRVGQVVNEGLNADGATFTLGPPVESRYSVYVDQTGHNIPDVFWEFMNGGGLVYENGSYVNGQVVDWLFAFGYPIGEAYWITARVGGQDTAVLVQPFERRVLTYVPSNPAGFQVEMGNVGQHYYRWRYGG
jgi:hypothetical protein